MKKIIITMFLLLSMCSCGNKEKTISLNRDNLFDFINLEVEFVDKNIKVNTSRVSDNIVFSEYSSVTISFSAKTIFDYDELRNTSFSVGIYFNADGTSTYKNDDYLYNFNAIVFEDIYISRIGGSVEVSGEYEVGKGKIIYLSNDDQEKKYNTFVNDIPKPGDEAYGSEGCLYRFLDGNKRLSLYSSSAGDIISASISKKHNSAKVTELGDGEALCVRHINGEHNIVNDKITSLKVSKYLEKINDSALMFAKKLTTIELPNTMKYIGKKAFYCADLSQGLVLPQGLETIDDFAFYNTNLTSIVIPNTVTYVGKFAFESCERLTIYVEKGTNTQGWHYNWDILEERTTLDDIRHEVCYL